MTYEIHTSLTIVYCLHSQKFKKNSVNYFSTASNLHITIRLNSKVRQFQYCAVGAHGL